MLAVPVQYETSSKSFSLVGCACVCMCAPKDDSVNNKAQSYHFIAFSKTFWWYARFCFVRICVSNIANSIPLSRRYNDQRAYQKDLIYFSPFWSESQVIWNKRSVGYIHNFCTARLLVFCQPFGSLNTKNRWREMILVGTSCGGHCGFSLQFGRFSWFLHGHHAPCSTLVVLS